MRFTQVVDRGYSRVHVQLHIFVRHKYLLPLIHRLKCVLLVINRNLCAFCNRLLFRHFQHDKISVSRSNTFRHLMLYLHI